MSINCHFWGAAGNTRVICLCYIILSPSYVLRLVVQWTGKGMTVLPSDKKVSLSHTHTKDRKIPYTFRDRWKVLKSFTERDRDIMHRPAVAPRPSDIRSPWKHSRCWLWCWWMSWASPGRAERGGRTSTAGDTSCPAHHGTVGSASRTAAGTRDTRGCWTLVHL